MSLDLHTLLVVSPLVIVTCCVLYLSSSIRRRGTTAVDRCWSLTFLGLLLTTLAYLLSGLGAMFWLANAVGNASFVLALGALWSGSRAFDGHPPRLLLVAATGVVTGVAALVPGPDGGPWAGALPYLAGLVGWSFAAALAIVRGRLQRYPAMVALAVVAAVYGAFSLVRAVVGFLLGFDSPEFTSWVGSEIATLVGMLVAVVGSFAMISVRAPEAYSDRSSEFRFDPYLGLRTPRSLLQTVGPALARAREAGLPSSVVLVALRDRDAIAGAFGQHVARDAFDRCADAVVAALPGAALVGTLPDRERTIVVVLPGTSDADAARVARTVEDGVRGQRIAAGDVELVLVPAVVRVSGTGSWRSLCEEATGALESLLAAQE